MIRETSSSSAYGDILERIEAALNAARVVFGRFRPGAVEAEYKIGHDPVTEADRAVNDVLRQNLLREGEGWLSEESVDDESRLSMNRVWIVDPLDGTREFVAGIPEFCVSIGFVENGRPVAGGIYNPATDETILGAIDSGVWYNGTPARCSDRTSLQGSQLLASRSEVNRGEWKQFQGAPFEVRAVGSVAYKLGLVAVGRADLTFTLTPKHEWDVAGGAALVLSAGGFLATPGNGNLCFNQSNPLLPGMIGCGPNLSQELMKYLKSFSKPAQIRPETTERRVSPPGIPLSITQERLWVMDQLHPSNTAQNLACGLRLTEVDKGALQAALDAVVQRHEILRTEFRVVDGAPVQVVLSHAALALNTVDLRHLAQHEREAELFRLAQQEAQNPFNLSAGPLLRALLVHLADPEYVLFVFCHRIVCDEASLRLLLGEVNSLYQAAKSHALQAGADVPLQYEEIAQKIVPSSVELAFWKRWLEGAPSTIDVLTDRQRPPVQSFCGDKQRTSIAAPLAERLRTLSQRHGAAVFNTLLTAFSVLLSRYARQEDLVLGTHVSGRGRPELENVIGPLHNMLALRIDASGDPTFAELLSRVRGVVEKAFHHQNVPFEMVVRELRVERDMSRHPIFQVAFSKKEPLAASNAALKFVEVEGSTEELDLRVEFAEEGNEIVLWFSYNSDLFDASTIARMVEHFRILLESAADDPDMQISRMPLLSEAERHQILVDWNSTHVDYPTSIPLHKFIEQQVEKTPDALAAIFETQQITYRELNKLANRLAHYLQARGVGPDVLVGVCAERSLELVIALLASIKAGGAYVPLDPEYPRDRLQAMLLDGNPRVVLTQQRLLDHLPPTTAEIFCLDRDWTALEAESVENPVTSVGPKNLAYVIYTSGSTGNPKGVPNIHEGIVNRLMWMQDAYRLTENDRVLQKTPFSFDVSVWEFFWPLMTGATLVVARPGGHRDPAYLVNLIAEQSITTLHFVPSMLSIFLESAGLERCGAVRQVMASGEALSFELQQQFFQRMNAELHNLYGPTEAAVDVTYWDCRRDGTQSIVPIGRPIANTQIYILDSRLQPVPIGVPGELHIGGIGLARGYLNRPELTAEKFILDPFSDRPEARLYKTGDLARFLADGAIEYLGRIDFQVKLRGFRIELGEIEAVLDECPGVRRAAVIVREDTPGDKRLVAYVIPVDRQLDTKELRRLLEDKLPEYMLPSRFVLMEDFPMTTSGKLDRKALPIPPLENGKLTMVPPRTQLEARLASLFASVLNLSSVGVTDNFFDLGGHSLLAGRLLAQVHEHFGKQVPLSAMFRGATVESLAKLLSEEAYGSTESIAMKIQPGDGTRLPFFAIVPPGEESIGYAMLARHMGPEQTVYKIQGFAPVLDGSRPYTQREMQDLTQDYVAAIRSVQSHGPYCLGGLCDGTHIAEQIVLSLEAQGEEVGVFAIFDTWVLQHSQVRWLWKVDYYRRRLREIKPKRLAERLTSYKALAENKVNLLLGKQAARTDWQQTYWPEDFSPPRFHAPVLLFKRPKQLFYYINDPEMGWGRRSESGVEIHEIDFHHREILREPHVRQFGVELAKCISRISRRVLNPERTTPSQPASSTVSVQQLRQGS